MNKIRAELYEIDMSNTVEMSRFYKKHRAYYENLNNALDKMTIEEFIVVKHKYCNALEQEKKYNDALTLLQQCYKLLDRLKNKSSEYYSNLHESTLFWEGVILGRLKKYSESNERFERLIIINPQNEKYQNWYFSNKDWIFKEKVVFWEYTLLAIMISVLLFGKFIFGEFLFYVELPIFILFIFWFIYRTIYRKVIRYREKCNLNNKSIE
jgi:hypothetical protein